jgi:hypothetical protein
MIGAGAVIGSLVGGNGNAARSPVPEIEIAQPVAIASTVASASKASSLREQAAPSTPELSPSAAVAMRFPPRWNAQTEADAQAEAAVPSRAYASESESLAPANGGYQLASVDPSAATAATPLPPKRKPAARNNFLFNDAQLASIKGRLKLTPQQEQYWPQVEQALRAISWRLATQQDPKRPVHGKQQAAMIDPNSAEVARLKSAAFPLIMSLREEQKQEVRKLAHTMGLAKVAAMF